MKLKTDWNYALLTAENHDEEKLLEQLYNSLNDKKYVHCFKKEGESGSLRIETYW